MPAPSEPRPPPATAALTALTDAQETAWIEVIRKMEEVYSDLIQYEVELEEKNKALEEAQRFITSVLASMSDVLVVCDARGRVQQVNQALLDLTGLSAAVLVGRPARALFADGWSPQACAADSPPREREVRFNAADGATAPVAINCSTRYDHRGRPAGMVLIGRPVGELRRAYEALNTAHAELKQAQQQLIQSEKMASIGRLVAGVAHELNNPISFIYGNVHSLQRYRDRLLAYLRAIHDGADPAARETLRRQLRIDHLMADLDPLIAGTLEGAERVAEIVKNLRRLSFSSAGEPEAFDLVAVIRTAAQWAAGGRRSPAALALRLPAALQVRGHSGPIHQVVVNLVENAIDAVADRAAATVTISAGADGGMARVAVEDNGPGIRAEHLLRVFDPFFTTKPAGHGTGLGLWISYGIVKDNGGTIEAANHPEGGARLCFTLPLA